MSDGSQRYHAKRNAGISSIRSDGSQTSAETDRQAAAAEEFAAKSFGQKFNSEVYSFHGDGGKDFEIQNAKFEVIHLGMVGEKPRMTGNLIVNPHEPRRWGDIYVVVRGSIDMGFEFSGWYLHEELIKRPRKNFGFGERYCCPVNELNDMVVLFEALKD